MCIAPSFEDRLTMFFAVRTWFLFLPLRASAWSLLLSSVRSDLRSTLLLFSISRLLCLLRPAIADELIKQLCW